MKIYEDIHIKEPITKGWSEDKKYRAAVADGTNYLLRITPISRYETRKSLFSMLERVAALEIPMCRPVEFGTCDDGVYALYSWIDGEDLETQLPKLSEPEQYVLGLQSGGIARKMHSIPAPEAQEDWETRFNRKTDMKIKKYRECGLRFDGDEYVLAYIEQNRNLLKNRPQCFQHGDYHAGNMMIENGELRIIDFDRYDFGDPWEEFNRIVWCAAASPCFATGQLRGYFGGEPPMEFWGLLAFYIASNTLSSIYWAIPFGQSDLDTMMKQAQDVLRWYDNMQNPVPSWYLSKYEIRDVSDENGNKTGRLLECGKDTKPGELRRVYTAALGELKTYRFTVIFARYNGKWLYARHKDRDTFETAGGHIEPGETTLDCAKCELYEETGAEKFSIFPAFDYAVHTETEFSYGQVFYADVRELGELPDYEMAEVREFTTIPDKLRFPQILPVLYDEMNKWLGRDKAKDEYWDVLDENRNLTGRKHRRIDDMQPGDYHLVVRAWIMNSRGEFLITRRAFNKIGFPGLWEIPSGSATAGEKSLEAAVREAKEECGIDLSPENGTLFSTYRRGNSFYDNWLFRQDFALTDVVLQEGETIDARAAAWNEIAGMMERGEFIGRDVFPEFELLVRAEINP